MTQENTEKMAGLTPAVSVVIPFFNHAEHIEKALSSIRDQLYPVLECIIVNDGSSKEQSSKLDVIIKKFLQSLEIIRVDQDNSGPGIARFEGAKIAQGDYIAFLDADDFWYPSKLECQISKMLVDRVDCSILDCHVTDKNQNKEFIHVNSRYLVDDKTLSVQNILTGKIINFTSTLVIKNEPEIVRHLDIQCRQREDHYFLISMIIGFTTSVYPEVQSHRVISESCVSVQKLENELQEFMCFYQALLDAFTITPLQKRVLSAGSCRWYGRRISKLAFMPGLKCYFRAFVLWPLMYLGSGFHHWFFPKLPFPDKFCERAKFDTSMTQIRAHD